MGVIKAKPIRLIDQLNVMSKDMYVIITFNGGRNSYSNKVGQAEIDFKPDLGKEVKGVTTSNGVIQIFI